MPNTDPNYWFLEPGLIPREPAFTAENSVQFLIDGEAYMSHLEDRIAEMNTGDFLHISGWRLTGSQALIPHVTAPFIDQIRFLCQQGTVVRAMLWYPPHITWARGLEIVWPLLADLFNALPGSGGSGFSSGSGGHAQENIDFVKEVNAAGGSAVLDTRLPHIMSSHHQKTIVLSALNRTWAYVGGIDICKDRWDTPAHNNSPDRTRENFDGWHDVHCAIQGEAAAQVWDNFSQRWNDPTPPTTISNPGIPPTVAPITDPRPAGVSAGNQYLQILRTLACGNTYSFMPAGEQTVRLAYEKAIDKAQHYIYIEDQYFWPCSVTQSLFNAAARGVKIILVMAHAYDAPVIDRFSNFMRQVALNTLINANSANVFYYHLQHPNFGSDIYVHSKIMIIDDCYAAIGSANINNRSHTNDSELHVAVVDGNIVDGSINGVNAGVCQFAKEFRQALWGEHLGISDLSRLDDPIASLAFWPNRSTSTPANPKQVYHAVCHYVPMPQTDNAQLIAAIEVVLANPLAASLLALLPLKVPSPFNDPMNFWLACP